MKQFAMEKLTKGVRQTKSPRCPLRTLKECAEEHGLHRITLDVSLVPSNPEFLIAAGGQG